jgi:signal recognition particle receptor subunit beta
MHIRNNIQVNFKGEKMTKNQIEKPTIIIPGAQKSGTTTLFNMLSKHSMVDSP